VRLWEQWRRRAGVWPTHACGGAAGVGCGGCAALGVAPLRRAQGPRRHRPGPACPGASAFPLSRVERGGGGGARTGKACRSPLWRGGLVEGSRVGSAQNRVGKAEAGGKRASRRERAGRGGWRGDPARHTGVLLISWSGHGPVVRGVNRFSGWVWPCMAP
jgi:hypothetical protein